MHVRNIRVENVNRRCRLSADIHFETNWVWGEDPFTLWYEFPAELASFVSAENADPFLPALLTSAMVVGEPLVISDAAAVSHKLLSAIPKIQDIYHCWDAAHSRVQVEAAVRSPVVPEPGDGRSALFYSLGVDSNYSLSKFIARAPANGPLPQLVMVEGFDVYLWERQRFPPMQRAAAELAAELGTRQLTITTNLRDLSDRITNWVRYFHGPALASTLLALGSYFSIAKIAASQTYRSLIPRGAHPLLDPLWSTEFTEFEHDGLEATRLEKVQAICRIPPLVRSLRVCATGELTDAYNCGRCEKCIRTMIGLYIAGGLEMCETLPHTIDLQKVRLLQPDNAVAVANLEELFSQLGTSQTDNDMRTALRERIDQFRPQPNAE